MKTTVYELITSKPLDSKLVSLLFSAAEPEQTELTAEQIENNEHWYGYTYSESEVVL